MKASALLEWHLSSTHQGVVFSLFFRAHPQFLLPQTEECFCEHRQTDKDGTQKCWYHSSCTAVVGNLILGPWAWYWWQILKSRSSDCMPDIPDLLYPLHIPSSTLTLACYIYCSGSSCTGTTHIWNQKICVMHYDKKLNGNVGMGIRNFLNKPLSHHLYQWIWSHTEYGFTCDNCAIATDSITKT